MLPLEQVTREHVHHLDTTQVLKVLVVSRRRLCIAIAVCQRRHGFAAITDGGRHGTVNLVDHALQEQALCPVTVARRRRRVLTGDRHLDLHPRDKFQDGSNTPLHLVHRRALRVHVPRLAGPPRVSAIQMCAINVADSR